MNQLMDEYLIDIVIQDYEASAIIKANEKYSVITTGLLEYLNFGKFCVKFQQKFIVLFGQSFKSLGRIRNLFLFSKDFSTEHTFYIIEDDQPYILLGQDWCRRHQVLFERIKWESRFHHLNQKDLQEETSEFLFLEFLEEQYIEANDIKEEFLIDLSENPNIYVQEEKEITHVDFLELNAEEFQKDFSKNSLSDKDDIITKEISYDFLEDLIDNYLDVKEFNQPSEKFRKNVRPRVLQSNFTSSCKRNFRKHYQQTPPLTFRKKCFLCDQPNHMMKECSLLPEFRSHELYCRTMGIHVWKSWNKFKTRPLERHEN